MTQGVLMRTSPSDPARTAGRASLWGVLAKGERPSALQVVCFAGY